MIADKYVKQDLRESWSTVLSTKEMVKANIVWAFAGGGYTSKQFRDLSFNLTLLFGFSVVERALTQMRDEGKFNSASSQLSTLMEKSKNKIPWINYDLIDEARNIRNDIAHKQQWIEQSECFRYLDGIEMELINWGVLK